MTLCSLILDSLGREESIFTYEVQKAYRRSVWKIEKRVLCIKNIEELSQTKSAEAAEGRSVGGASAAISAETG